MASDSEDSKQTAASGLRVLPSDVREAKASGGGTPSPRDGTPRSSSSVGPPPSSPAGPPRSTSGAGPPLSTRYGAGDVIADKYRLGRRLGAGGMGEVWLAHNETLDIDVAIKLIRGDVATPEMADRLLHEARAAARLGHPAIVRVNDFGKTKRDDPFIVMELLDGEDLASALQRRGRLSAIKAVRTLLPITHALTVAHTKGIVHRDLKPENVFLAKNDDGQIRPKLVDFGVAKLEKQHSHRLTQSGALLGSPLYMSPEQARGDDVDHRADIWALAVVLYESITGRPPFEGKNYNAVLYSIIANPPTPITDLDVGDAELWTILERGFQKDPDRRWYSMRDFGEALAMWLQDHNVQEDITGASLQTTWLQWKKDEDQLGGLSTRPPPDESTGALPPPPTITAEITAEARSREITVRRRRVKQSEMLIGGAALLVLLVGLIVIALSRSSSHAHAPADPPAVPAASAALRTPTVATPEDSIHEQAVEQALAAAGSPAPVPSAAPAVPAPRGSAEKPHHAVSAPRPTFSGARGIVTTDPYASSGKRPTLKNPFQ